MSIPTVKTAIRACEEARARAAFFHCGDKKVDEVESLIDSLRAAIMEENMATAPEEGLKIPPETYLGIKAMARLGHLRQAAGI